MLVDLKCRSCGAALQVSTEMDSFACSYCGSTLAVERSGGVVGLRLVTQAIAKVQAGTDKTAAELALRRLRDELASLQAERAAAAKQGQGIMGGACVGLACGFLLLLAFTFPSSFLGDVVPSIRLPGIVLGLLVTAASGLLVYQFNRPNPELHRLDLLIAERERRVEENRKITES